jgi:hypothetical protein
MEDHIKLHNYMRGVAGISEPEPTEPESIIEAETETVAESLDGEFREE